MVTRDGTRPLLVEVQGLVDPSRLGAPRRVAQGIDAGRLAMVLAVLHRHGGVSLQEHDVFANVVGGLDIDEPAWDLPVALALASSLRDFALPPDLVVFGELGLTGEVRPVTLRRGAHPRGGQARLQARAGAGGQRAARAGGRHRSARRGADRRRADAGCSAEPPAIIAPCSPN